MAGSAAILTPSVSVVPGETTTCTVRVRNTGSVVDSYSLTVLGHPAAWTTVVPAALSLFPDADGTIELHFAPPRTANVGSGPTPFGVRVVGTEDPDNPVVEEGEVTLLPFVELAAKITPRTSETKRKARHEVIVDNKGNAPLSVTLAASDPDEQLAFQLEQTDVTVEAGQSRHVPLKVAARKGFARGADKHRPFQVKVTPAGGAFPIQLDGNLIQKPGMPRFVVPLVAGAVAVALVAAILPGVLKKDGKGNLQLASDDAPTTTTAAPAAEEPEDPNAPATAEEQAAAAAAELEANGKDPNAPSLGGSIGGDDGGTSAAGSGGGAPAATTPTTSVADTPPAGGGGGGGTATTAPPAAAPPPSVTSTSAAPATTTTTSPSDVSMYSFWKQGAQARYDNVGTGTFGQTFKATAPFVLRAGVNLNGVSGAPASVVVRIRQGGPTGAVVATSPATAVVQWGETTATFPKTALTVGALYYLEGVWASGANLQVWSSTTNDYPDGDGFLNGAPRGYDLNARITGRTS